MAEILELRTVKEPKIIIDDTIDDTILFPEKLAEAKAKFAKFGLPKGLEKKTPTKSKESAFWLSGILQRADGANNTFLLISLDKDTPTNYTINTVPEMLHQLVKTSWCATIQVYIQPQINDKKQFEYELIEVKVD
ncbi:MAG: hypothetical protein U5L45_02395 [Saprospiraceae bacterium]|nr:hypothetical protein [Saprospiraceae bacterium]